LSGDEGEFEIEVIIVAQPEEEGGPRGRSRRIRILREEEVSLSSYHEDHELVLILDPTG
jgi:hypothetical protein